MAFVSVWWLPSCPDPLNYVMELLPQHQCGAGLTVLSARELLTPIGPGVLLGLGDIGELTLGTQARGP